MRELYNQLDVEKNANSENKKKMEQKFFMEKNKMEMEVQYSSEYDSPFAISYKNVLGDEKNCSIRRKSSKRGDFCNVRDNAKGVQG